MFKTMYLDCYAAESEFDLDRPDLLHLLRQVINDAMRGIEIHDALVGKLEVKEGRVRAFPLVDKHTPKRCPEFFDVALRPQLESALRDWASGPVRPVPKFPPDPVFTDHEKAIWEGIEGRLAKANAGDVFYLNPIDFTTTVRKTRGRLDISTLLDEVRAGFMGVLYEPDESPPKASLKSVEIHINRSIPKGLAYCVPSRDPNLETPPAGTYVKGSPVALKQEFLFVIGPVG